MTPSRWRSGAAAVIPDKNPSYSTSLFVQPAGSVAEPWWMREPFPVVMVKPEPEGNNRFLFEEAGAAPSKYSSKRAWRTATSSMSGVGAWSGLWGGWGSIEGTPLALLGSRAAPGATKASIDSSIEVIFTF
jgi:hypothetical protein